jgi:diguanylate cyclase (GGDEF)-like protein
MTPFLKRNLLRAISLILFTGLLYSYNKILPAIGPHLEHVEFIAIGFIISLTLVIMLIWGVFGTFAGMVSFLFSMLLLYKSITDLNPYYYSVLIGAFFLNSFIGHHIQKKISVSTQAYTVDSEKAHEDINLIRNHVTNRRNELSAMGEKVSSMLKLKNIADKLSLTLSNEKLIKIIGEETFNIFGNNTRVLIFTFDEQRKELNLNFTKRKKDRKVYAMKNGGIFDRWVLKNAKSLLVRDKNRDFRFSIVGDEVMDDALSIIIKPLIIENKVLGIIRVDCKKAGVFEQHELRILDIIGDLSALALENARLYNQTEELAIKDSLTGLFVHRYFMERLDEEVKRALRSDISFSLLMMDIDDFKNFNDQNGHIAGDSVLENIGKILKSKASAGDIVARYGGEEFAFLALNSNRDEAIRLAQSIKEEIQNSPVVLRREKCNVTMSIGVAVFPEDAKLKEDIIWEADRYLYKAKSKGKNAVCSK